MLPELAMDLMENKEDSSLITNWDTDFARIVRAENQHSYLFSKDALGKTEYEKTFGASSRDRITSCRVNIFGATTEDSFPAVRGFDNPNKEYVLCKDIDKYTDSWLDLTDECYEKVREVEDPIEKNKAATRLASLFYVLGVRIHPRNDGNGQILKTVANGYLSELSTEWKEKYLPIKLSRNDTSNPLDIAFSDLSGRFEPLKVTPKNDLDKELLHLLALEAKFSDFMSNDKGEWDEVHAQLLRLRDNYGIEVFNKGLVDDPESSEFYVIGELKNDIGDILSSEGHTNSEVFYTVFHHLPKHLLATQSIELMLFTPDIREALLEFVTTGKIRDNFVSPAIKKNFNVYLEDISSTMTKLDAMHATSI